MSRAPRQVLARFVTLVETALCALLILSGCGARSDLTVPQDVARSDAPRIDVPLFDAAHDALDVSVLDVSVLDVPVPTDGPAPTDGADCAVDACGAPVQLALGQHHSCARWSSGIVRCWGANDVGQLGDGTNEDRARPTPVVTMTDARWISAGYRHTCAVRMDLSLWCWGDNASGQLGVGPTPAMSPRPIRVSLPGPAYSVSLGLAHSCTSVGGAAYCWGENDQGQVGDGTRTTRFAPVRLFGIVGPTSGPVAAGARHTCVGDSAGGMWCWGLNADGQYGDGTSTPRLAPTPPPVRPLNGDMVAGCITCRVASDTVLCSGPNEYGQLGDGTTTSRLVGVMPRSPSFRSNDAVAVGCGHACFVDRTGVVRCSGWNDFGELGDGTRTRRGTMLVVRGVTNPSALALGHHHACAVGSDRVLRCWGQGARGQLGDGTVGSVSPVPVVVTW